MTLQTTAIVLAAGKGTRMKSPLPKVLYPVLGRPMIHWVIDALEKIGVTRKILVIGYEADMVKAELANRTGIEFALQEQQLGTGHAVQMAAPLLSAADQSVIVLAGDSPLVQASSLQRLLSHFESGQFDCLLGTLHKDNPFGLGRIVRDSAGSFSKIVEQKDATEEEKQITEVNMSTYAFRTEALLWALLRLSNQNAQGEFYLTDCPAILRNAGNRVEATAVLEPCESLSINTQEEALLVEAKMKEMGYPCAS
ncbi:MAG: NTP transferase domain-containing protein [Planctomycetaceae bacterium]|nr:NTP transferase domain-containing protein [Planctomycetaceae bacterium]